jgi:hypothetical protein
MPFALQIMSTHKTQEEVKQTLMSRFTVDDYQDKLRLKLKREGGKRGFVRLLFHKVKTYVKVRDGKANCNMQLEIVGVVMLFVSIMAAIAAVTLPPEGEESIPAWAPIATSVWYLVYSFVSISKTEKFIHSTLA